MSWIKLHKKILDWEWYGDLPVRSTFIHLLLKANWKDSKHKGEVVKRGQVIVGSIKTPQEIGISRQQFRRSLDVLKRTNEITTKPTSKNTVVTIVKYDDYQEKEFTETIETTTIPTSKQPSNNHQITTSKEYIEYKNNRSIDIKNIIFNNILMSSIEIEDAKRFLSEKDFFYFVWAQKFRRLFIKNLKKNQSPTTHQDNAKFKSYVDPIRLMFTKDKIDNDQLERVFSFLENEEQSENGFSWQKNILSTSKLRKQFQSLSMKSTNGNSKGITSTYER